MSMTVSRCIRCFAIATLLMASCPETPSAAEASLRGRVTGPDRAPLADTRVVVASRQSDFQQSLRTDRQGRFGAENLPPGIDYEIRVGNDRGVFSTTIQDRVVLRAGEVTWEPFQLQYTIHYRVEVKGRSEPHIVNMREVGNRTVYDHNFIKGLPVFCGF